MNEEPKFRGDEPGVNWLIHVLTENVGRVEWVPNSPEEQEAHRKKMKEMGMPKKEQEYPFKVVRHPIPDGTDIRLVDSKEFIIACNNEDIRDYVIGMAERLEYFRNEYWRLARDAAPWHDGSDTSHEGPHYSWRHRRVQVDSSALRYVGGFFTGFYDWEQGKWFVLLGDRPVEHKIERWRELPRAPGNTAEYETVKEEAERLRGIYEEQSNQIREHYESLGLIKKRKK